MTDYAEPFGAGDGASAQKERVGGPPEPYSPSLNADAPHDIGAEILIYEHDNRIQFADEFKDPNVNIQHERDKSNHQVVTGHKSGEHYGDRPEFMIQALGQRPPSVTIDGWITENQLRTADNMVSANIVGVITARFVGTAVPISVDIPYSRNYHEEHGWLFNVSIELKGSRWDGIPLQEDMTTIEDQIEELELGP